MRKGKVIAEIGSSKDALCGPVWWLVKNVATVKRECNYQTVKGSFFYSGVTVSWHNPFVYVKTKPYFRKGRT